jgi:NAD+ synthase (glutamine-hydrolysing)
MSKSQNIQLVQFNPQVGHIHENSQRILEIVNDNKMKAPVLWVFPELCITGYPPEDLLMRDDFLLSVENAVENITSNIDQDYLILGTPIRSEGKMYNAAVVLHNRSILTTYHKQILPNYDVFDEKRYFSSGTGPCVFTINDINFGLTICEDIWRTQPAQEACDAGANIIININASPYDIEKYNLRRNVAGDRVSEVKLPIIYINQVGGQDELVFDGSSFVLDSKNKLVTVMPSFEEAIENVQFSKDSGFTEYKNKKQSPSMEKQLYEALVCGTRDYVVKNGFSKAIIGLSGGIDSALTLLIAVDALGAENVTAVMMPSKYTSNVSKEDAEKLAKRLTVSYEVIPIENINKEYLLSLGQYFKNLPPDITEENIQARIRGSLLMAFSNKFGSMLLATGNKSEFAVGYATLYGDMAGAFAPLKDVYKTDVYRLVQYRNTISDIIPQRTIEREPTAELSFDQKDTDTLPTYSELDVILKMFIEEDASVEAIILNGHPENIVRDITRLVLKNEHKRRQSPPGIKITERAFGKDRRYPITSKFKISDPNIQENQ